MWAMKRGGGGGEGVIVVLSCMCNGVRGLMSNGITSEVKGI